jgi:predicted dehydrogenase
LSIPRSWLTRVIAGIRMPSLLEDCPEGRVPHDLCLPSLHRVREPRMLDVGLIGLGRHGLRYARHLLEPSSPARLVAVCRRDPAQGAAFARQHGLYFYADFRELVADPRVQAVIVVTPPSWNKDICLESVRRGKPLMIEKPLSTNGDTASEMVQAAEAANVPLMTAQTLRFDSAVQALKAALSTVEPRRYLVLTNRIEPRAGLDARGYGGRGVLLEIGIHLLDLVRFLTEEEVSEVRCETDVTGQPESHAWARLKTQRGFTCLLDVSRIAAGRVSRAEWLGEKGQLLAEWSEHRFSVISGTAGRIEQAVPDTPTVIAALKAFVTAVQEGRPMPITGRDGQRAVAIADACYRSALEGRVINL